MAWGLIHHSPSEKNITQGYSAVWTETSIFRKQARFIAYFYVYKIYEANLTSSVVGTLADLETGQGEGTDVKLIWPILTEVFFLKEDTEHPILARMDSLLLRMASTSEFVSQRTNQQ